MSLAIASRYARALADLVFAPNAGVAPPLALEQIRSFHQTIESAPHLRAALLSPAAPAVKKRAVVSKLAARLGLSPLMRNFLFVVMDHRRLPMLGEIGEAFEKAMDDRLGRVRAVVTSSAALTPEQQRKIEIQLAARTGKQVRSEYRVNGDLVGGVSVQIGSTIYDGSVRGRLNALRTRMASE